MLQIIPLKFFNLIMRKNIAILRRIIFIDVGWREASFKREDHIYTEH